MTTSSTDSSQVSLTDRTETNPMLYLYAGGTRYSRDNASQEDPQSDAAREDGVLDFDEDAVSSPVASQIINVLLHPEDVDQVRPVIYSSV